jgi:GLPGLI family protein
MKKIIITIPFLLAFCLTTIAQTKIIQAGTIEFERTLNQHKLMDDNTQEESGWMEQMKAKTQKMVVDIFSLQFSATQSIFKLKGENTDNKYMWGEKPSETDLILKNLSTSTITSVREVFEKNYIIKDSLLQYTWKITGETREIAGFECKKAVTKICDSVVVVAFYTEAIEVSNGPESFVGLPGMILGLAIPRLYMTYFATKIDPVTPLEDAFNPKIKGTTTNYTSIVKEVLKATKEWGNYGSKKLWNIML